MKCLYDRLSTCMDSDLLWIAEPVIGSINISRLTRILRSIDPGAWYGKRVAIGSLPVLEFVFALTFLDGLAQAIILLPTEDDLQKRKSRLEQEKIDIVVEGDGFGFAKLLVHSDITDTQIKPCSTIADRPSAIQTAWLLPTSGTTGNPKLIAHTFASLTRSMTARRIGEDYKWGSLYSLRRFAGLQVFLQSWMCSTPLILTEDGADLNVVLNQFIELRCNALSATPSMWRKMAMHPLFERLDLKQITLGGEIVDQAVLDMLIKRFPTARITHIYASTEAGVGFAVRDGRAGFPSDYLYYPPFGAAMRIDDQNHLCFSAIKDHLLPKDAEDNWIDSGDIVEIKGNRIFFLGRANGSINVGGNKVMPEEIESVIKELPGVAFVQVHARKSSVLGNLVEAAIIPMPGTNIDTAFKKKVISHCQTRLDEFKVPAFIIEADNIQLTASGKLSRTNIS